MKIVLFNFFNVSPVPIYINLFSIFREMFEYLAANTCTIFLVCDKYIFSCSFALVDFVVFLIL